MQVLPGVTDDHCGRLRRLDAGFLLPSSFLLGMSAFSSLLGMAFSFLSAHGSFPSPGMAVSSLLDMAFSSLLDMAVSSRLGTAGFLFSISLPFLLWTWQFNFVLVWHSFGYGRVSASLSLLSGGSGLP